MFLNCFGSSIFIFLFSISSTYTFTPILEINRTCRGIRYIMNIVFKSPLLSLSCLLTSSTLHLLHLFPPPSLPFSFFLPSSSLHLTPPFFLLLLFIYFFYIPSSSLHLLFLSSFFISTFTPPFFLLLLFIYSSFLPSSSLHLLHLFSPSPHLLLPIYSSAPPLYPSFLLLFFLFSISSPSTPNSSPHPS